jgi:hypothetical protein
MVFDRWDQWIQFHYMGIAPMLLPMYLVILCALSVLMENRASNWKSLFSLPIPKSIIYVAKLMVVLMVFAGSHLLYVVVFSAIPHVLGLEFIGTSIPLLYLVKLYLSTIIASLGILGIVFLFSYFVSSFVFPLALGIIGFVLAQLMMDNGISPELFPFAHPTLATNLLLEKGYVSFHILVYSAIYFLLFTVVGALNGGWKRAG